MPLIWPNWSKDGLNGEQATHIGPKTLVKNYTLSEIPILVSAGAVIPLKTMASLAAVAPDPLVWAIFVPGDLQTTVAEGRGSVYEDDGSSKAYETEAGERLELEYRGDWAGEVDVTITPSTVGAGGTRGHVLQLRGLQQHQLRKLVAVGISSNGEESVVKLAALADTAEPVDARTDTPGWWTHTGHSLSISAAAEHYC